MNLLVFREGRKCVSGSELMLETLRELSALNSSSSEEELLRALLRAGELECATADAGVASSSVEAVTDQLAAALVGSGGLLKSPELASSLAQVSVPDQLTISTPEGFAYYGLHPLAYADVLNAVPLFSDRVLVVGIRSIGTTLSAITAAAARKQGKSTSRITVRPQGHPYNRKTQFQSGQQELIRQQVALDADFLVVDEGPGLSGSSFLSVADALLAAGVSRERITLLCGHQPDFKSFCCADGPRRAKQFRWIAVPPAARKPANAEIYIGAGEWRRVLLKDKGSWPPSWITFERNKFLTAAENPEPRLFKFFGYGHYGDEVQRREKIAADAGFGPVPRYESDGFVSYERLAGRPMSAQNVNERVLLRLAEYCAFRQRSFKAHSADLRALNEMARHNLEQLEIDIPIQLRLQHPVIADGRMQPHEWLLLADGKMLKTDCGSHGDDHFFPGPTDIAWDLAGAIVEWRMDGSQSEAFLAHYYRLSGDGADHRINDFVAGYSVFRAGYCLMAANAMQGSAEEYRLRIAAEEYRARIPSRLAAEIA